MIPVRDHVQFEVRGLPIAQGNARAFVLGGHARIATEANRPNSPLGAWRAAIRTEGQAAMEGGPLFDGACWVMVSFAMPRPKSHFGARGLKPSAPYWHIGRPDLDKLLRALFDGLTNVVVREDAIIAQLQASKVYGDVPGCIVSLGLKPPDRISEVDVPALGLA